MKGTDKIFVDLRDILESIEEAQTEFARNNLSSHYSKKEVYELFDELIESIINDYS